LKKSLSSRLFFRVAYTWSKSLDIESAGQALTIENVYNLNGDWGPSDFNLGQMLVISGVYALPFGNKAATSARANGLARYLSSGWNVASIITVDSGLPFNAAAGGDVANVGGGTERAQRVGPPYSGSGFQQSHLHWVNPASFQVPAQYTFGNEGRNDLVGPAYRDVDFDVFKDSKLGEWGKWELRGEFFNLFNHSNYSTPTTSVASTAFGQITAVNGNGREIQVALKVMF
jgi:hypothetical protein